MQGLLGGTVGGEWVEVRGARRRFQLGFDTLRSEAWVLTSDGWGEPVVWLWDICLLL